MLPVDIIGVNEAGIPAFPAMFAGKPLSWLRDTAALHIETSWQATYRDVIILGPLNGKVDSYNLTAFPLYDPADPDNATYAANRLAMKNKLIAAATPVDTDHDRLPDFWETKNFGNLSRNGATVGAGGWKTLHLYAHAGLAPGLTIPDGLPRIVAYADGAVSVLYTRRRGTALGLTVTPEFSQNLAAWAGSAPGWAEVVLNRRTLYDGSCGEELEWKVSAPGAWRYVRVKAVLP